MNQSETGANVWAMTDQTPPNTSAASPTNSDSHQGTREQWEVWMAKLMAKLYLARTIKVDADRRRFFVESVMSQAMTRDQAIIAWDWIVYGDWTMKGANPTVELADFWPSEEAVNATVQRMKDRGLVVMTTEHVRKLESRHYGQGHSDGFAEGYEVGKAAGENVGALRDKLTAMK